MVYDINQFMKSAAFDLESLDGDSIGKMPVDPDRLRYVTRLLGYRQGLNTALLGTLLFTLNAREALFPWLHGWWGAVAALAWLVLLVVVLRILMTDRISKYYEQRFGAVQAARAPVSRASALSFLAFLVLIFVLIFRRAPIVQYLDPVVSGLHVILHDPGRQIDLWPSVLWVMLLCSTLRWHMSGIERQRLFFVLVGLIGFASIVAYAIWHPNAQQLGLWKMLNSGGFGLSLIALGLYDHVVLVRALPKTAREGNNE